MYWTNHADFSQLRELVALAATTLGGKVADEDKDLADSELERSPVRRFTRLVFPVIILTAVQEYIAPILEAISQHLDHDTTHLGRLLPPEEHGQSREMPTAILHVSNDVAASQIELSRTRLAFAQDVQRLHVLYRQVLGTCIRTLEQTMHGSVARSTKAKAEYLATVAEGMGKKLAVQHAQLQQQIYSPELIEALKLRDETMWDEGVVLRRKIREAEERLEKYRTARGIAGMVKEYAEILRESQKVEEEIGRLEGR